MTTRRAERPKAAPAVCDFWNQGRKVSASLRTGPGTLAANGRATSKNYRTRAWVAAIHNLTVLAQKETFIIQQNQTACDSKLHTKHFFSWSIRGGWALVKLEARSAADSLSVAIWVKVVIFILQLYFSYQQKV